MGFGIIINKNILVNIMTLVFVWIKSNCRQCVTKARKTKKKANKHRFITVSVVLSTAQFVQSGRYSSMMSDSKKKFIDTGAYIPTTKSKLRRFF